MTKKLLIIFIKNPELGKVKTRLAATIGDTEALKIYSKLLAHTLNITQNLNIDKSVYYSDHIDENDQWTTSIYQKSIQKGKNLGEKMENAFIDGFSKGYTDICLIGSDCLELSIGHIDHAFKMLHSKTVVLGPSYDGGYYLIGLNQLINKIFHDKAWSTSSVLEDTLQDVKELNLSYFLLERLNDIDEAKDLPANWKK